MADAGLVSYLNLQGYSPIAIPREQFDPLRIIGGPSQTELSYLGTLSTVLKSGTPLPEISRDDDAAAFGNRLSNVLDAKVGLQFLGSVLKAFGVASANASAAYSGAKWLQYLFLNVQHDYIAPLDLMSTVTLATLNAAVVAKLQTIPYVYIVSDTLKSNLFAVVAYDEQNAKLELNADAIKGLVGVNAGVGVSNGKNSSVSYNGPKPLRFAFRAISAKFYADKDPEINIDTEFLVARAVARKTLPPEAYEVLAPGQAINLVD
jgi:hypothetical protein